jgi:hypothetical protein
VYRQAIFISGREEHGAINFQEMWVDISSNLHESSSTVNVSPVYSSYAGVRKAFTWFLMLSVVGLSLASSC